MGQSPRHHRNILCDLAPKGMLKMLICANISEGAPVRLYRSPGEIKRDISLISSQIRGMDEMLSIRNVLAEMLDRYALQDPEQWIPELQRMTDEAAETLERLQRFKQTLDGLHNELEETLCVMRG